MKKQILFETTALLFFVIAAASLAILCATALRVNGAERETRAVEFVYGKGADGRAVSVNEDLAESVYGTAEKAYLLGDGNYLVKSTGLGGFKSGTVSVWTAFACTGNASDDTLIFHGIKSVTIDSNSKQSYISRVKQSFFREFTLHDEEILQGKRFSSFRDGGVYNLTTGASYSSAAIDNAVNAAIVWFEKQILQTERGEKYAFEAFIDLEKSEAAVSENKVEYRLVTKPNSPARSFTLAICVQNGIISDYEIIENGSTGDKYIALMPQSVKDGTRFIGKDRESVLALLTENGELSGTDTTLETGATKSALSCLRAAAFALSNYEPILREGGMR